MFRTGLVICNSFDSDVKWDVGVGKLYYFKGNTFIASSCIKEKLHLFWHLEMPCELCTDHRHIITIIIIIL